MSADAPDEGCSQIGGFLADARRLLARGNAEAAVSRLKAGLEVSPESPSLQVALGDALGEVGDDAGALDHYESRLDIDPDDEHCLLGLSECLARQPALACSLSSSDHLMKALVSPVLDPELIARGAFARLRQSSDLLRDPLLPAVLSNALITDPGLERTLTGVRKDLCLQSASAPTQLGQALAEQARLNDFAWQVSAQERHELPTAPSWVRTMYLQDEPDHDLVARAQRIRSLTEVSAGNSQDVRSLYEQHPYPRWQRITRSRSRRLDQYLPTLASKSPVVRDLPQHPTMLVAGCGTGRELLGAALAWQPASITGFDLSRASLAYAQLMAERLQVSVELCQADLLELGYWDRRFDVIVCTGVLHHLQDPLVGWRNLRRLLRPGGLMFIGLYSDVARRGIALAQDEVRRAGWAPSPEGIRAAREHVSNLPAGHPARDAMLLRDFYYSGGCRDMLFHVQEHRFTIPEIESALQELELDFLDFDVDPRVRKLYRTLFGPRPELEYWQVLEKLYPRTFLGMYQFWCRARPSP